MAIDITIRKVTITQAPVGWVYRKDIPYSLKVSKYSYQRWLRQLFVKEPILKESYNRRGIKSKHAHVDDFIIIVKKFTECENVEIIFTEG